MRPQIFHVGGPIGHERPLDAAASGPAGSGRPQLPQPSVVQINADIGEAARAIKQQLRAEERNAEPTAHGAEPIHAPRRAVPGRPAASGARSLDVGLHAHNEKRRNLEVISGLTATCDAAARSICVIQGEALVPTSAVPAPDEVVVVICTEPRATNVDAAIYAGPRVNGRRRHINRCLFSGRKVGGEGRSGGNDKGHCRGGVGQSGESPRDMGRHV